MDQSITETQKIEQNLQDERFRRVNLLYGKNFTEWLESKTVMVIGIGGVGSWSCESLIRSGIKNLVLVDLDEVCVSNFNRQIHTLDSNIGQSKTQAMKTRLESLRPDCNITLIEDFYTLTTSDKILDLEPDWIIDAIDSLSPKCMLISESKKRDINLVVTGGAGGKKDPNCIQTADLNFSFNDGLLMRARKKLRREYGFPKEKTNYNIDCVFSKEKSIIENPKEDSQNKKRIINCHNSLGTASFITGQFGLMAASVVINRLAQEYIHCSEKNVGKPTFH